MGAIARVKLRKKEILLALVSSAVGLAISLLAAEIYFFKINQNQWVAPLTQFDPGLGWANVPNSVLTYSGKTYTTNSLGFRSGEIDPAKNHVLVVGDSVVFGAGVSDNETLSYFLSQDLGKYQVLNLGVSGYSIDQYYLSLKKHVGKTNPKFIVVVIFTGNDWEETLSNNMHGIDKPFFIVENGELKLTNDSISKFSCKNTFSKSWVLRRLSLNRFGANICDYKRPDDDYGKKIIHALLKRIGDLASQRGARLLFVLSPTLFDYFSEACSPGSSAGFCRENTLAFQKFLLEKINRAKEDDSKEYASLVFKKYLSGFAYLLTSLQNILKNENFDYIDLFEKFKTQSIDLTPLYNNEPYHYSPAGNKLLAKVVSEHLNEQYPGVFQGN